MLNRIFFVFVLCIFFLPRNTDAIDDQTENSTDNENFEVHDISDEYLNFTLKKEDIKIINNKEDFNNCIDDLCQVNILIFSIWCIKIAMLLIKTVSYVYVKELFFSIFTTWEKLKLLL